MSIYQQTDIFSSIHQSKNTKRRRDEGREGGGGEKEKEVKRKGKKRKGMEKSGASFARQARSKRVINAFREQLNFIYVLF